MTRFSTAWPSGWLRSRPEALGFFFSQLARLLEAVGSLSEALSLISGQVGSSDIEEAARDLHRMVTSGMPLGAAMAVRGDPFRPTWTRLVEAAEEAGNLPAALDRIAARIARSASMAQGVRSALVYPLFLIHGALLLWPIGTLITDGPGVYFGRVALSIGIVWGVAAVGIAAAVRSVRKARDAGVPPRLPVIGPILGELRAAEACWSLGSLYEAGTNLRSAVDFAFPGPLDPASAAGQALARFRDGSDFSGLVRDSGLFPVDTVRVVQIAETAGNLGESLLAEGRRLEDRATARLEKLAKTAGRAIYLIAVVAAVFVILSFWTDYLGRISSF
jgi:type II secretory pathway component PulF